MSPRGRRRSWAAFLAVAAALVAFAAVVGVRTSGTGTPTRALTATRNADSGLHCGGEQDPSPTQRGYGVPTGFSLDHVQMTDGPLSVTKATAQGCGNLEFPFSLGNEHDPNWTPDPTKPFAGAGVPANQVAFTPGAISLAGIPLIGGQANITTAPGSTTYAVLHQQTDATTPGAIDMDMWTTLVGTMVFSYAGQTLMTCNVAPINVDLSNTFPGDKALQGPLNDVTGVVSSVPFKVVLTGCPTVASQIPVLGGLIDSLTAQQIASALQLLASGNATLTANANMALNLGNPAAIPPPANS